MSVEASASPEMHPTPDQRRRLANWLRELGDICVRNHVVLRQVRGDIQIIDRPSEHLIGLDLDVQDDLAGTLTIYAVDSILDGVWLVESSGAIVEQRSLPDFPDDLFRSAE